AGFVEFLGGDAAGKLRIEQHIGAERLDVHEFAVAELHAIRGTGYGTEQGGHRIRRVGGGTSQVGGTLDVDGRLSGYDVCRRDGEQDDGRSPAHDHDLLLQRAESLQYTALARLAVP